MPQTPIDALVEHAVKAITQLELDASRLASGRDTTDSLEARNHANRLHAALHEALPEITALRRTAEELPGLAARIEALEQARSYTQPSIDGSDIDAFALHAALKEVREWISNWNPNFEQDDEWPATREKMEAALKGAPRPA
jgi:hypothetical protein